VDAIGGSFKFPQSWNRYIYSRDNPLIAIDPDGMEIKIIAYSPAFKASVEGALRSIEGKSPRLKVMVQGLRSSQNVHKIQETSTDQPGNRADSQEDADNGKGTGSTIYTGLFGMDEGGNVMTIDEVLSHELSHAEDADTGTRDDKPACNGCASKKETKAVQMQNQLRPGNPRVNFGKLRVPNPTATPKDPRKKQGAENTRRKKM